MTGLTHIRAGEGDSIWVRGFGIDYKIPGELVDGRFAMVEGPMDPGALERLEILLQPAGCWHDDRLWTLAYDAVVKAQACGIPRVAFDEAGHYPDTLCGNSTSAIRAKANPSSRFITSSGSA